MKVMVLGLRSIPGVAGGIETHCEHLYPNIARAGVDVEILVRSAHAQPRGGIRWRGLRLRRLWSPRKSGIETFFHTFLGVVYASWMRPDILHLHAVGPALFAPLARLFGLTVVVTHHGSDYERAKWGPFGKWVLKTGERMAMRYANAIISVSRSKAAELTAEYNRESIFIPNGVPIISPVESQEILEELGIVSGRYVLHVGRCAPEKRQDDLIAAFVQARLPGWRLVFVGDMGSNDQYSQRIRKMAEQHPEVVLAGFRSGEPLRSLFTNAGCFALPSAVEGFSIALLEALSAGCVVVASDIPANHEIDLPAECYFAVGDIAEMSTALSTVPATVAADTWAALRDRVRTEFDWQRIAESTVRVYSSTIRASTVPTSIGGRPENQPERTQKGREREFTNAS